MYCVIGLGTVYDKIRHFSMGVCMSYLKLSMLIQTVMKIATKHWMLGA